MKFAIIVCRDSKRKQHCKPIQVIYENKKDYNHIVPQHMSDFVKNQIYYVYWSVCGKKCKAEEKCCSYYDCIIVALGESEKEAWENAEKNSYRLIWKPKFESSESTDTQNEVENSQKKKLNQIKQQVIKESKKIRTDAVLLKYKATKLLNSRTPLVDKVQNEPNTDTQNEPNTDTQNELNTDTQNEPNTDTQNDPSPHKSSLAKRQIQGQQALFLTKMIILVLGLGLDMSRRQVQGLGPNLHLYLGRGLGPGLSPGLAQVLAQGLGSKLWQSFDPTFDPSFGPGLDQNLSPGLGPGLDRNLNLGLDPDLVLDHVVRGLNVLFSDFTFGRVHVLGPTFLCLQIFFSPKSLGHVLGHGFRLMPLYHVHVLCHIVSILMVLISPNLLVHVLSHVIQCLEVPFSSNPLVHALSHALPCLEFLVSALPPKDQLQMIPFSLMPLNHVHVLRYVVWILMVLFSPNPLAHVPSFPLLLNHFQQEEEDISPENESKSKWQMLMVHLGQNVFVQQQTYEMMKRCSRVGLYRRDLARAIWGDGKEFANQCLTPDGITTIYPELGPVKIFNPNRIELYLSMEVTTPLSDEIAYEVKRYKSGNVKDKTPLCVEEPYEDELSDSFLEED
ncbi:hypothetical protein TKK_0010232 [Trichogramma kaykai]